jgi:Carboxypeptidase regulatory-like domain/TonB dependent receptor
MNALKRAGLLFLGLMAMESCAYAQSSGSIEGTVTDSTGAVIANATVSAQNTATGVETTHVTNAAGLFVLELTPGEYRVQASATGFQSVVHERVTVDALANVPLDIQLSIGTASSEVRVTATVEGVHTEDATLGTTMRNEVYAALPLAMNLGVPRDPTSFIAFAPGVAALVLQSAGPSYTSFNGARQEVNGLYFEGLPVTFSNQQGDTRPLALGVSVDAVNQFQVEINGEKAQWQGQGFHNYVIKNGTDQFHGSLFEILRNTDLDARNYFFKFVPTDRQNEYGGNIGGPIKKGKLFFFGNYDAYDFNTTTAPALLSIPSLAERMGDFSALPTPIYDPASQVCNGAICTKTQFPGNKIPANRLSTVSQSLASYLPTPTQSGYVNNYVNPLSRSIWNKNTTERFDYHINDKHTLYGVFAYGEWHTDYTGNITPTGTALPLPYTSSPGMVVEKPLIIQVHDTYTFGPSLLNTFGAGMVRLAIPIFPITKSGMYPQKAGLGGLPGNGEAANAFPLITFNGPNPPSSWGSTGPFNEFENDYVGQDSLEWVHGNHILNFGGQFTATQDNRANPTDGTSASFTFTNNETAGYSATGALLTGNTGNGYASYLLGAVDSASITNNNVVESGPRFSNFSFWAQDDWKASSKLTLNLGLRWDAYRPYREQYDRLSYMVPTLPNPSAGGIGGAMVYGGQPVKTHWRNFQPRIGLAYALNPKTVLRAGFVMAYSTGALGIGGNGGTGPGQQGYNPPTLISSVVTGQPAFFWNGGVPAPVTPSPLLTAGFGAGNSTTNPTGAIAPDYINPTLAGRPTQYTNWSAGFQRELPYAFVLGVAYSGSVGHFLPLAGALGAYTNSMSPQYLALGSLLNAKATPATIASAQAIFPNVALPFSNFSGTIATMLTPFPQYAATALVCYSCDVGNSSYHSLQLTVNRRLAQGLNVQLAWTLAKEIDDINGSSSQLGAVTGGTRNPFSSESDRGLGVIDHRNNIHLLSVYDLPFGRGLLGGGNALVRNLVSGWALSGTYVLVTGNPDGVTGTGCTTPGILSTCMVNVTPGFKGPIYTSKIGTGNVFTADYINKAAFQDPAPYTFGNEPRSAPFGLVAPTLWEIDGTVRRTIKIYERVNFQFAADFFNVANNVVFSAPATNIDSSNFGQVASTQNQARHIQFSGRLTF